jgi:glutathionylspermidine synthase
MERRRKISWLPVQADWSEEGRDNGVCFQVREGIKYWCDSEEDPESDPEDEPDLDDRFMKLGFMCCTAMAYCVKGNQGQRTIS